jgi:hypothetical protein
VEVRKLGSASKREWSSRFISFFAVFLLLDVLAARQKAMTAKEEGKTPLNHIREAFAQTVEPHVAEEK